jgi:hypothetical protein
VTSSSYLQQVAAYGLPYQHRTFPDSPLDQASWASLFRAVTAQRLAGFLQAAVEDGELPVTAEQAEQVAELHVRWCASALRLEHLLLQLAQTLESEGLEMVVLKGSAVAHLVYPDAAWRSFGDIDLLLRSEDFDRSIEVLSRSGYVRQTAQARPGFERRFGKGATLEGAGGEELDLHRNLVFGTFGFLIDLDELFRSAVSFELGDRTLRALGAETRLLHACYHTALGDPRPRFSSIRDVAQMLATGDHDPERVLALAHQWRAEAVVARAVDLCRTHLGVEVGGPIVDGVAGYVPTRRERRAIASYVGRNQRFAAKVVATLPYLANTRDRAAFLLAVTAPEREFVTSHGGRPGWAWIRRGMRSLFRGGRA